MKKLFLVFLILSVVFGFAQSVSADGEPGFSPTFKKVEKKPIGIINYEGLFIDLNINDIGDWKNPAKKWRKGYKIGCRYWTQHGKPITVTQMERASTRYPKLP